jgi:fatty-acyl-CoA synthase
VARRPPQTLTAMLGARAGDRADGVALVCGARRLTFAELDDHARRIANGLSELSVGEGDRVAVWLPNCMAWVELEFALARLGAIAIAINTRFRAEEVGDILERSEARLLALWPGFKGIDFSGILGAIGEDRLRRLETLVTVGGAAAPDADAGALRADVRAVAYEDLLAHDAMDDDHAHPDAPCNAFTSSGTTGAPKLVLHAQQAIAVHSDAVARGFGYREPDCVVLGMLPFCGVFGFNTIVGALAAGAPSVLMPVFEARAAVDLIERERVTNTNGSDEMLRRILAEAQPPERIASLREAGFAAFGGDARTLVDAADALGKTFYMAYGSSEVQALLAHQPADAPPEIRARAGGPPVHEDTDVRVRSVDDGSLQPPGASGELEIRGPSVTVGYLGDDQAARTAFTDDGYLRSGDLGSLTERGDFLYLTRRGDVLRLGGFLVSPVEIEDFLEKLEPIRAAQVVGVDTPSGAQPVAFVIPAPDRDVDEQWIIGRCAAELARFKVPRRVICVDEFPTTPSANGERIQRQVLRRRAAELVDAV